jgi:hypothetical protein
MRTCLTNGLKGRGVLSAPSKLMKDMGFSP